MIPSGVEGPWVFHLLYNVATVPLTSGTKLGPYEIQSALGAGGMGEVYRARDTRLDRTVAIKILPTHLSANAEARSVLRADVVERADVGMVQGGEIDRRRYLNCRRFRADRRAQEPKTLFQTGIRHSVPTEGYDVARDGRFLMVNSIMESTAPAVLVTNWDADLKK